MRQLLKILYLSAIVVLVSKPSIAQGIKDPTKWTYEAQKTGTNEFTLTFNLKLDKGFHIWSLKPGGDGFQVIPSFTFEKNEKIKLLGTIIEHGKLITETMEGVEGKVNFYSNEVKYTQIVAAPEGTIIKGVHEYQVCNDIMCLPPTTQPFTFNLK